MEIMYRKTSILCGSLKNSIFRVGFRKKTMCRKIVERGGVWTVCKFKKGAWGKRGRDTPIHAMTNNM